MLGLRIRGEDSRRLALRAYGIGLGSEGLESRVLQAQ